MHTKSYYIVRNIVRTIVWTAMMFAAGFIFIATIWAIWAIAS